MGRRLHEERPVHYGCHEFRDDCERVIQGRAHPELEQLHAAHLAFCGDCQRYHHRLEAIYRRPRKLAPLDSFARDHEFDAILERTGQGQARDTRRLSPSAGVALLASVAAVLALALIFPSFGARLFGPPAAAKIDLHSDAYVSYGDEVRIPVRGGIAHQGQRFGRVIGGSTGDLEFIDAEGLPTTSDSLTVGSRIVTGASAVQVAFVGRLIANFQPETIASWNSASSTLVEFGLVSGSLAFRYDRRPGDPILQVRTPSALVRVIGTVFTVAVDERGRTTVSVLRGKVEVLNPDNGRSLGEVEAGFRFDVDDSSYRDVGRREVAAALPLSEQSELLVSISDDGELTFEEPARAAGQIPRSWTVPGLSDDPAQRTLDRVLDPDAEGVPSSGLASGNAHPPRPARARSRVEEGKAATLELIDSHARRRREREAQVEARLERCRALQSEPETRFRAARCLGDFMHEFGDRPEAVEGLLLLGTLRMDFAHDYQSATRNFEEFLRRAPQHPKAELARYKLVLAAFEAGYIDRALARGRTYLRHYPDGQYVGRILQRFPELKSEI
jgi:hypothetical protein